MVVDYHRSGLFFLREGPKFRNDVQSFELRARYHLPIDLSALTSRLVDMYGAGGRDHPIDSDIMPFGGHHLVDELTVVDDVDHD